MKCDELKAEQWLDYSGEPMPCYPKAKVDAAIAELKEFAEDACLERDDNQNAIHELQAEIERLKAKLEDVQATAYTESVDAGMRERRLRRALYKACANWAHVSVAYFSSYATKENWRKMENKCHAKAEQYEWRRLKDEKERL